ncbi:hypothetical protein BDV97DRAFT_367403 [Delphinella strobiligena]|nr:hypothetical protein BDV97DRAFT_367403 [Delphinella strobiligena]
MAAESSSKSPSLLDLPNELLTLVFEHLDPILSPLSLAQDRDIPHFSFENERTLSHVSLTGKLLRELAERVLYRTFLKEPSARELTGPLHILRLRKFLYTLCKRPDLRVHVRRMIIGEWDTTVLNRRLKSRLGSERHQWKKQTAIFMAAIRLFRFSHLAGWKDMLRQGNEDAEIALLFFLTPSLVELHIALAAKWGLNRSLRRAFSMTPSSQLPGAIERLYWPRFHGFKELERVTVAANVSPYLYHLINHASKIMEPPDDPLTLYSLADGLIQAPRVKSLCVIGDYRRKSDDWSVSKGANVAIRSIVLRESKIRMTEIAILVANAICLKIFELSFKCNACHNCPQHTKWPQVVAALRSRGGTIRKLKLASALRCFLVQGAHVEMHIMELDWRRVGSLQCFTALEELTICETALLGSETYSRHMKSAGDPWPECTLLNVLPTNLRLLRVLDCTWFTITHLQALATSLPRDRSRTSLQKILLKVLKEGEVNLTAKPSLTNGGYVKPANEVRKLFEALEKVGISCNLGISYGRNRSPDLVWLVKT